MSGALSAHPLGGQRDKYWVNVKKDRWTCDFRKMAPKKSINYFAALEEEDEKPAIVFPPSIFGGAVGFTAPPLAAAASSASTAASAVGMDLRSVVAELDVAAAGLARPEAAWDFGSFGAASSAAEAQMLQDAAAGKAEAKRLMEKHLARLHASDEAKLEERTMKARGSTKQNKRKAEAAEAAEAVKARLSGKVKRNADSARRLHQAKSDR
jgi:hypothetical protein